MSDELDCLFVPHRVAVVGAGTKPTNLGHMVVRNLLDSNFQGVVYPINPKHESIGGVPAFPSVLETPESPDMAILCVPAVGVLDVVKQCAQAGIKGIVCLAAGFREVGAEGRAMEDKVVAVCRENGMRLLGPNCLGLQVPDHRLNATFAAHMPKPGNIALVSQSGALTAALIEWAIAKGIGFSKIATLGNAADVELAAMLDYLADDPETHSAVVYAESISNAQAFTAAASRFTAKKPLIVYKAGRFAASAKAAVSHTGAMAGADSVYNAAFERVGVTRVLRISDLYHTIELLSADRGAHKPTLAVVTNAGGPGVMSVDALSERGGRLAEISESTLESLNEVLPTAWSHANPIDVLGDASAKRYEAAINAAVTEADADGILVILTPQAMTDISGSADAVIAASKTTDKPVLAVWMGGGAENEKAVAKLAGAGIPTFEFPENAVDAFMNEVASQDAVDAAAARITAPTDGFTPDGKRAAELIASVPETGLLPETESKELFDAYGIPVALPKLATSAAEAAKVADAMGYPVVAKIASPDITHKTDVGGVVVGPKNAEEVKAAYEKIVANAKAAKPDAHIEGVVIEQMVPAGNAELILGSTRDSSFGQTIMIAAGGTSAEILKDSALQLAPVDAALARRMVESLRIWPLIKGYRGAEGADVDALVKVITRFSTLVAEHPEITETEMNPLTVSPSGAIALDARAVIDRDALANPPAKYSHLGILPR